MREPSNRKKVMLTLILSAEDNDILTDAAKDIDTNITAQSS
jgi:hypothetical protein